MEVQRKVLLKLEAETGDTGRCSRDGDAWTGAGKMGSFGNLSGVEKNAFESEQGHRDGGLRGTEPVVRCD